MGKSSLIRAILGEVDINVRISSKPVSISLRLSLADSAVLHFVLTFNNLEENLGIVFSYRANK